MNGETIQSTELSADGDVLALLMEDTSNSNSSSGADSMEQDVQFYNWKFLARNWELVRTQMMTRSATVQNNFSLRICIVQ